MINLNLSNAQKIFVLVTCIFFWILVIIGIWSVTFGPNYDEELRQFVLTENKRTIEYVNSETNDLHKFVNNENEKLYERINKLLTR